MNRLKRNLVYSVLVAFALWPAVHIGLVKHYNLNPWKLGGWGMYSAPQYPQSKVRIICFTPDETYELTKLEPTLNIVAQEFLHRHQDLRDLVEPAALSHAVFDLYSAVEGVRVEVILPVMNRDTGMIEESSTTYEYHR